MPERWVVDPVVRVGFSPSSPGSVAQRRPPVTVNHVSHTKVRVLPGPPCPRRRMRRGVSEARLPSPTLGGDTMARDQLVVGGGLQHRRQKGPIPLCASQCPVAQRIAAAAS